MMRSKCDHQIEAGARRAGSMRPFVWLSSGQISDG
jgi:hypothetical protein